MENSAEAVALTTRLWTPIGRCCFTLRLVLPFGSLVRRAVRQFARKHTKPEIRKIKFEKTETLKM